MRSLFPYCLFLKKSSPNLLFDLIVFEVLLNYKASFFVVTVISNKAAKIEMTALIKKGTAGVLLKLVQSATKIIEAGKAVIEKARL